MRKSRIRFHTRWSRELNLSNHISRLSWAAAARILPPISGLIFILTIMPALSVAEFGRYTLIFTIATQIVFLNKSLILNPMIKFAAEPGRFGRMSGVGLAASLVVYIVLGLVVVALSPIAAHILRIEPRDVVLAAILPFFYWIRDWGFCVQQTLYRTGRLFIIEAVYYIGAAAGYVWLWERGGVTVGQVLAVNFALALASSVTTFILWPKDVRVAPKEVIGEFTPLVKYGFYTLGIGISASLLAGADALVIGAIYTPETVGIYAGAKRIYAVVSTLLSSVGLLVMPYASKLQAEGRKLEVRVLLEKSVAYLTAGLLGVVAVGWLLAGPFYQFIMPSKYSTSAPLFRLLLTAAPFEGLSNITGSVLYGIGAATLVAQGSLLGLGILIILLPLGAYFFGLPGAAAAQVAGAMSSGIVMYVIAAKHTGATLRGMVGRYGGILKSRSDKSSRDGK